ncbi:MAG TPA: hypothetical protein RMH99_03835 [Sandaracinaceae bacterium LLY-WYZ-13_1]|nr:hypothetical protein [Sandaracinaceae bacterium LLY-WYZ-13_1]
MRRLPSAPLAPLAVLACLAAGCGGASVDRETTLARLRDAMQEEIPPGEEAVLEDHNQLVERVRDGNVLDGMRRFEVEEALGRGQECGARELCARHEFAPDDWVYEVGRRDGLPWGPTIIVGFDRQGIVNDVYTLTRR